MGMRASTALIPVSSGVVTGARSIIRGAGRSTGIRTVADTGPLQSRADPVGVITRPNRLSPTGTSIRRKVRATLIPAHNSVLASNSTQETESSSRSKASPNAPPSNATSSSYPTPGNPEIRAIPSDTDATVPVSLNTNAGRCDSRVRRILSNVVSIAAESSLGMSKVPLPCHVFQLFLG
jgi:hypothetical protein